MGEETSAIRLLRDHANRVSRILQANLPAEATVYVFGSRATGHGLKPHSDLDLLIDSPAELPVRVLADLREAFAESNLPFAVDVLQRRDASAGFLSSIEANGLIGWSTATLAA